MKLSFTTSKKTPPKKFKTRFPPLWRGLGWGFLFLLTLSVQAQKTGELNKAAISDSLKIEFYKSAKLAKLTDKTTADLLKIIDERNVVVANFIKKRERHNAPFNVQDPWVMYNYKIDQAQKHYAKKIKELISYDQYGYFVVVNFKEEAEEKSKSEFKQLIDANPNLTEEQKAKLYNLINGYQLSLLITTAYYNSDKNLQKAKQGALTFNFEKKFAETCKEFNIKIDKLKQSSANNFQWN